jgi:hypothetical protein
MQALAAVYQLSQSIELAPSPGGAVKVSLSVGLRGSFHCDQCSESQRIERGFCPFVENCERATVPTFLGEQELWACPQGIALRNPGLTSTLRRFFEIQATSVSGYFGGGGLVNEAPRVAATFAELVGIERRFESEVMKTRREMDQRGGA